jgi:steroid 5-alpha reductase family enzyme
MPAGQHVGEYLMHNVYNIYNLLVLVGVAAGFLLTFERGNTRGVVLLVVAGFVAIVGESAVQGAQDGRPWVMLPMRNAYGIRLLGIAAALGVGIALLVGWMRR